MQFLDEDSKPCFEMLIADISKPHFKTSTRKNHATYKAWVQKTFHWHIRYLWYKIIQPASF